MREYGKHVKCPPWTAGSTPAEERIISAGVARIYESTVRTARTSILNYGTFKTWHGMLFKGAVPLAYYAGNFRSLDPQHPCLQSGIVIGTSTGVEPGHVLENMIRLSEELRINDFHLQNYLLTESRPRYKTLAKLGLVAPAMGLFIKIHPFANGNGRIARLLANNLCYRYELPMPFRQPSKRPLEQGYADAGKAAMRADFKPTFEYLLGLVEDLADPN